MKSPAIPQHEAIVEPPSPEFIQPALGQDAVRAAERQLHHQIQADQWAEKGDFTQELVKQGVPDPRYTRAPKRIVRAIRGEPFSSQEDREALQDWLTPEAARLDSLPEQMDTRRHEREVYAESAQKNLQFQLGLVRARLGKLSPVQIEAVDKRLAGEEVPAVILAAKQHAEAAAGRPLSWASWLATEATPGQPTGSTDGQLLNVMQWSVHKLQKGNEDPAVKAQLAAEKSRMRSLLDHAAHHGSVSRLLADRFDEVDGRTQVFIGDIFDLSLLDLEGYYAPEEGNSCIVVTPDHDVDTFVHENLHNLGGYIHRLIDEAATTNLVATLLEDAPDKATYPIYPDERGVLDKLQKVAGITPMDVSITYAGADRAENQQLFRNLVQERFGADLLGFTLQTYDDAVKSCRANDKEMSPLVANMLAAREARHIVEFIGFYTQAVVAGSQMPIGEGTIYEGAAEFVRHNRQSIIAAHQARVQ